MIDLIIMIFFLLFLMLIRVPIYIAFLTSSLIAVLFFVPVPFTTIVQNMYSSLDKFALMAVPFFIFAAEMMSRQGMVNKLINWVSLFIGRVRGGLGVTTVASANLFGAISGSSPATVAAMGKIMYPYMKKEYGEQFSLGLITSVGALSMIIPPSIGMILYGIAANASIGKLFIAGVIPGVLIGIFLIIYVLFYAWKNKIVEYREESRHFWQVTREAAWPIGVPIIIIGGIYSGIFTPTESAAIAAVYTILVSVLVYRDTSMKEIMQVATDSCLLTAKIFILVAASSFFTYFLSINQVSQMLSDWIQGMTQSPLIVLLMINVILLIVGMFIEPNSAILIFTPLFLPVVTEMGVDPIHFGIIVTVNLAIGMYTPPFGLNIFVASATLKAPIAKIVPGLLPFTLVSLVALYLITAYPQLSLFLVQWVQ